MKIKAKKSRFAPKPLKNRSSLRAQKLRNSAYFFATAVGLWLPKSYAAVLVDLDATGLPTGALNVWTNTGTLVGNFVSPTNAIPAVTTVQLSLIHI